MTLTMPHVLKNCIYPRHKLKYMYIFKGAEIKFHLYLGKIAAKILE